MRSRHFYANYCLILASSILPSQVSAAPGWSLETFSNVTGTEISQLTASDSFFTPQGISTVTSSKLPSNIGSNYGTRIRGYITAPQSGLYTFHESGDHSVTLFLSPDENPANKQVVAYHSGNTLPEQWDKYVTQSSRQIYLTAGKKYYLEVLHKESTGDDHLAIAWTPPDSDLSLIPLSAMETFEEAEISGDAGLYREFYGNIAGTSIANLQNSPAFQGFPTSSNLQATGESPQNVADKYGTRIRGYITPQISGTYTFWESGDDAVQLYLSPTANPADKQMIASHSGWTNPNEWEKYASQKSRGISLTAGKSYYIEVLHKDGGINDNLSIAWTSPDGIREILPNSVLTAWSASAQDQDDDSLPDEFELSIGLDPNSRADVMADHDGNTIPTKYEYLNFANPVVKDEVNGVVSDDVWFNIKGDYLNRAVYKSASLSNPGRQTYVTSSQAIDAGDYYVRRIRGFITAPTTGSYQFWAMADNDVDFFLSTTSSKFQLQQLIRSNAMASNFDVDPSQKSQTLDLVAGQKYYFELWHKEGFGGASVKLAWKTPTMARNIISSHFLSSFNVDPGDLDDDDLPDSYELVNGLNSNDSGRSAGSNEGAFGDLDGDGLTNREEWQNETAANLADSDGNGVSDYDEVNFFGSATLANSIGAFTNVATLSGDSYSNAFGEWSKINGCARQVSRRGSVTYPITVPTSGVYALKFAVSSVVDGAKNELHDFQLKINGQHIAYKTITILPDSTSTLAILTPWLQAGETYNLELFVDNSYNWRRVSIDSLEILAAGGIDTNENSTPDWVDIRLNETNGFDNTVVFSKTSPAVLEGNAKHMSLLNTGGVPVTKAPNGRFFTEVQLTAGSPTTLDFAFENGAVTRSASVQWLPTNLLHETNMTIRQGDSLLLTAFHDAENASLESYSIAANGQQYTNTSDQPSQVVFDTPGTTTIQVSHTNSESGVTNGIVTVTILPRIAITPPICVVDSPRSWTHPALPSGASLEFDHQLNHWKEPTANTYTIVASTPINQQMIVRHDATGLILGNSELKNVGMRSDDKTGNYATETYPTYQVIALPVVMTGDMSEVEVSCEIFIGGVTFTDGTTVKTIRYTDLDETGVAKLYFNKPKTAHSNCHRYSVWHKGVRIAHYN